MKQHSGGANKSARGVSPKAKRDREFFRVDANIHFFSGLVPHEERTNILSKVLPSNFVSPGASGTLKRVDISGAGISFESDDFYALGDIVAVKMMFNKDWAVPLLVYGEVVRVEPYRRYCRVAVKYVAMDERIKSIIIRFVSEREREIIAEKRVGRL
jgi:hypothetical protein